MNANVGKLDRTLRIAVGSGLVAATALHLAGPWGWIGLVPLATGLFGFCPAYTVLGLNSCGAARRRG